MKKERISSATDGGAEGVTLSAQDAYAARLRGFENFYLFLVVGCGVLCAAAILIAVYYKVSVGVLAAVLTALIYRYFLGDELKKQLGLTACRVSDGLAVRVVRRNADTEELRLPARLLWLDVTELTGIEDGQGEGVTALYLPATLKRIAEDALANCPSLQTLYFDGTPEEWDAVQKPELSGIEMIAKEV